MRQFPPNSIDHGTTITAVVFRNIHILNTVDEVQSETHIEPTHNTRRAKVTVLAKLPRNCSTSSGFHQNTSRILGDRSRDMPK
jgi:hypothetical protein